jgi:hypothetical protein
MSWLSIEVLEVKALKESSSSIGADEMESLERVPSGWFSLHPRLKPNYSCVYLVGMVVLRV